ncbi:MAG TPA: Rieske 2Fe-2S domain-containing protein [Candidatus Acidoferrum sp.]|nr:Rieske 2Fe-2S domain-containing protein [Candidatus Acidoferrum sp.]
MLQLCRLDDLVAGKPRRVKVGDHHLLAVRTGDNAVRIFLNRCPHLGIPLAWQDAQLLSADGAHLQCSTHGALFLFDTGFCVSGPCQGDQLWSFTCEVVAGDVFLDETELPTLPTAR